MFTFAIVYRRYAVQCPVYSGVHVLDAKLTHPLAANPIMPWFEIRSVLGHPSKQTAAKAWHTRRGDASTGS